MKSSKSPVIISRKREITRMMTSKIRKKIKVRYRKKIIMREKKMMRIISNLLRLY